jgi:ribosome-binding factor A
MEHQSFDRHDRVRSLLSELVASYIREEANTDPLITVTRLDIAPNYRNVTVFFTTIPVEGQDDALIFLKRKGGELRGYVMKHSTMKIVPFFTFEIDYGERNRQHIDEIAGKIGRGEE